MEWIQKSIRYRKEWKKVKEKKIIPRKKEKKKERRKITDNTKRKKKKIKSARKEIEFFPLLENNNFWHAIRDIFVLLPFSLITYTLCFWSLLFFHFGMYSFLFGTGSRYDVNFGNNQKKIKVLSPEPYNKKYKANHNSENKSTN